MSNFKNYLEGSTERIDFLDDRFYKVGDEYFPSVTTILEAYPKGPAFIQWIKDVGNNAKMIAERAAAAGTKVHDAAEKLILGQELEWDGVNYDENEWAGVCRFYEFFINHVVKVHACELKIFSQIYKYAGTVDLIAELSDGRTWLIDYKFGNAIYDSYFLQQAAYMNAWNERSNTVKIDCYGLLHLKAKTKGFKKLKGEWVPDGLQGEGWSVVGSKNSFENDFDDFLATLKIWRRENPEAKPKNKIYPAKLKLKKD